MAEEGEIVRVTLAYTHPYGSVANNVFMFVLKNSPDDGDLFADVLEWVGTELGPLWQDIAATAVQLYAAYVDIILGNGHVSRDLGGELVELDGEQGGDPTEPGSSFNLTAYTDVPKSRGRKFFPGLSDSNIVGGVLDSNVLAKLAELAFVYITTFVGTNGSTLAPGVLSRVTETFNEFNGNVLFGDVPRSQRRRQPDVGS